MDYDVLKRRGEIIRKARKYKGIKQKDLAAMLGYKDASTLLKVEKGIQGLPVDKLAKACDILEISYEDIVGCRPFRKNHISRTEDNACMIAKISGSTSGSVDECTLFLLHAITTVLIDISKSLAIIADNTALIEEEPRSEQAR